MSENVRIATDKNISHYSNNKGNAAKKKISFNLENLNLSTTANMPTISKFNNMTHSKSISILENTINPLGDVNASKAIVNKFNENKFIKKEILADIGQVMTNSPTNKASTVFKKKGKTENITILNKFNCNLPNIEQKIVVSRENERNSTSSISFHPRKKLTGKSIEEEMKYLKEFVKTNFHKLEDASIYKNLGVERLNKNVVRMNDYAYSQKMKSLKIPTDENKEKYKIVENAINNPSLGNEYLRKTFAGYFSDHKIGPYDNRFKKNYSKKYFDSVLFAKRVRKEDDSKKYDNVKNTKFTQMTKLKMKWKTIKWIIENKKEVLERLMNFYERIVNLSNKNEFDKGLNKQDFVKMMKSNGVTNDTGLINKLFWVFDEDGDQNLKFKEIAFGIEMFIDSSIEKKLKSFFDLCDVDNSGSISKQEFSNLLRKNIINNDEKIGMKQVVDKIFSSVKLDKNGEITFEKLKEGCEKNREIHDIIYKNILALRNVDNSIDKDIKNDLMRFNPDLNDQLRMKLLSMRISFIPLREEKFARMLDGFLANRERLLEINKLREVNEEDSYEAEEEDTALFKDEQEFVKEFMVYKNSQDEK